MSENEPKEEQPTQAVNIEEPDTENQFVEGEEEFDDEQAEDNEEEDTVTAGAQAVVMVKHKPEPVEPVKEITLQPTSEQVDALKSVLKVLAALNIDEATFKYNGNLAVRVMDPARVSMLNAEINMGVGFENLTETPPVTRKFTVNLPQLARALMMDDPKFEIGQAEIVCSTKKVKTTIPVLEDSDEDFPLPKLNLGITTNVDIKEVCAAIKKYLGKDATPSALTFVSESGKLSVKGVTDLQKFEMSDFTATADGKATFSYQLLEALATRDWEISFSSDMPMKAAKNIMHTEYDYQSKKPPTVTKIAAISVFLAPRIETE